MTGIISLLVMIGYLWFFITGVQFNLPKTFDYYDQLTQSFLHRQLFLETKPDPALLTLPDPYEMNLRGHIPYPWDSSLYGGHFYIYWGPAPALVMMPIKAIYHEKIWDYDIAFIAIAGLFLICMLLLIDLQKKFFPKLPIWLLGSGILLVGFAAPIPLMLNQPAIYEASIASGQLFLVGGIYCIYKAFSKITLSTWKLIITAAFWTLAVGSRITLVFPIFILWILSCYWLINYSRQSPNSLKLLSQLVAFGLPLAIGLSALGWYNWARFGSVLEFGLRYQLTGRNLNKLSGLTFLPSYIPTNIYNYFFNPFRFLPRFPFLGIRGGTDTMFINRGAPTIYRSEPVMGLVYDFPFAIFALIPVIAAIRGFSKKKSMGMDDDGKTHERLLNWMVLSLTGSTLISMMVLLAFFDSSMRYIADVSPSLAVLSILGFWYGYRMTENSWRKKLIIILGCGLSFVSILVSILLTLSNFVNK